MAETGRLSFRLFVRVSYKFFLSLYSGGLGGNRYRGGTKDATTSSSLIVSLFIMMSFDDFLPSETAIFV